MEKSAARMVFAWASRNARQVCLRHHELCRLQRVIRTEASVGVTRQVDHQLHGLLGRAAVGRVQRRLRLGRQPPEGHPLFGVHGTSLAKNSSRFAGIASDRGGGPARAPPQLTDRVALRQHSMIDRVIINHVRLKQPIRHCESGLPPTLSLVLELNEEELDALVHKATTDAYRRWAGHA